jgi:hypothetical protein
MAVTEAEWLECADASKLVQFLMARDVPQGRYAWLALDWCRRVQWRGFPTQSAFGTVRPAYEAWLTGAGPRPTGSDGIETWIMAEWAFDSLVGSARTEGTSKAVDVLTKTDCHLPLYASLEAAALVAADAANAVKYEVALLERPGPAGPLEWAAIERVRAEYRAHVLDVTGNPFRPAALDPPGCGGTGGPSRP